MRDPRLCAQDLGPTVMDESRFWLELQYRLSGEFRQMQDRHLRHLWCDGFDPVGVESDYRGTWIVGRAWIMGGGDSKYSFRLRIGESGASRSDLDWSALMPDDDATAWLSLDLFGKSIEIDPFAAIPDDETAPE